MTGTNEHRWPLRPIGDMLKLVSRLVDVQLDIMYRQTGIRSHCKGIFHKPETIGKKLATFESDLGEVDQKLNGYLKELGL